MKLDRVLFRDGVPCVKYEYVSGPRSGEVNYCKGNIGKCLKCGKEYFYFNYQIKVGKGKYCSHKCSIIGTSRLDILGDKNPSWNGGTTRLGTIIRSSGRYYEWRSSVLNRDNFTCQDCGVIGFEIHAHHIRKFSEYPDLRFEIANGITLCKTCHKKVHRNTSH